MIQVDMNITMRKAPHCPLCQKCFLFKGRKHRKLDVCKYLPRLLHCGHTLCGPCVNISQNNGSVSCPVCKNETVLREGPVNNLETDVYVLGLCELDKQLTLSRMNCKVHYSVRERTSSSSSTDKMKNKIVCGECEVELATSKCAKCDCAFCNNCFDKVHKNSKVLMSHQALPLQHDTFSQPAMCSLHSKQPIEFFCEEDQMMICSHCVVIGDHKGHSVTSLIEIEERAVSQLKPTVDEALTVLNQMIESERVITNSIAIKKKECQQIMESIGAHFHQAHGLLQTREAALISDARRKYEEFEKEIEHMRTELQNSILPLTETIRAAKMIILEAEQAVEVKNAQHILGKLKEAISQSCYAEEAEIKESEGLSCSFSDSLSDAIHSYGKVEGQMRNVFQLKPLSGVPANKRPMAVHRLDLDFPLSDQVNKATVFCTPEIKNQLSQHSAVEDVTPQDVLVTHIKSPHHFLIQKCSDLDEIHKLEKKINHYCNNQDSTDSIPKTVAKGDFVLSFYEDTWYRAQVLQILSVNNDAKNEETSEVEVLNIDYGNTNIVNLDMLRIMKPEFMEVPQSAKLCSLADIVPAGQTGEWSPAAISTFARMTANTDLQMWIKQEKDGVLFVDLSKRSYATQNNICLESISDALVFLEHARFLSHDSVSSSPSFVMPKPKLQYPKAVIPCEGSVVPCFVSYAETPQKFFIQQLGPESDSLYKMMVKIHAVYTKEKTDLYTVFYPQKDMVCAALYEQDQVWYRAQIIELQSCQKVKVRYVDYGNEEYISHLNLRHLLDDFVSLPVQAIECQLADVIPLDEDTGWTKEALDIFNEVVCSKNMEITVQDVIDDSILSVVLKEHVRNENLALTDPMCCNKWLVEQGLAKSTGPCSNLETSAVCPEAIYSATDFELYDMDLESDCHTEAASDDLLTDKPAGVEVRISHVFSPDELYLQFTSSDKERLKLMSDLKKYFDRHGKKRKYNAKVGVLCAVLHPQDKQWYRAEVLSICGGKAKVRLVDYGCCINVQVDNIHHLPRQFSKQQRYALLCHLEGIRPAGDSKGWTRTSLEYLSTILNDATCYVDIQPQSSSDGVSVGLPDLIKKETIFGGALTGDQIIYKSVKHLILEKGLALPKRSIIRRHSPVNNKQVPGSSGTSLEGMLTENKDVATASGVECQASDSSLTDTAPSLQSVSQPADNIIAMPSCEYHHYRLPELPNEMPMTVVLTYVDYDCHVYVQSMKPDDHPEGRLGCMLKETTIEVLLQNKYFEKMMLYRANIIRDGNCLFRAFALALFGDQDKHQEVRRMAVDKLQHHWWLFENMLPGETKSEYIEHMSKDGTYGGEAEICALCSAYQIRVNLYMGGLLTPVICRTYGDGYGTVVQLSYMCDGQYDFGHYDLIVDNLDLVDKAETAYSMWRAEKVRDYQLSSRYTNSNSYDNSILEQLMRYLQEKYSTSKHEPNTVWQIGQALVAQYPDDNLFYRAKIISIEQMGYKVKYVDFGNDQIVPATMLRSGLALPEIPIQCYECILHGIQPVSEDGKWSVPVLDKIQSMLAGKTFSMYVKKVLENQTLVVDLQDNQGNSMISRFLTKGLAKLSEEGFVSDEEAKDDLELNIGNTVQDDGAIVIGQFKYGIPKRTVVSPYPNHIVLHENDIIPCLVTQVDSPYEVYLQRNKYEEPITDEMIEVNRQIDQLIEVQEILNRDYATYKTIKTSKIGLACCAKYSIDQCWYRAEILGMGFGPNKNLCAVLLVDYGSLEYTEPTNLLELPSNLLPYTVQAIRCCLFGICSPAGAPEHSATKAMIVKLTSEPLVAVVRSCTDQYEVDLYHRDVFSQSGQLAPLVYTELIQNGIIQHTDNSDALVEEVYEEECESSDNNEPSG